MFFLLFISKAFSQFYSNNIIVFYFLYTYLHNAFVVLVKKIVLTALFFTMFYYNDGISLVGVEGASTSPNLPTNIPKPEQKKVSSKKDKKNQKNTKTSSNKMIQSGEKPADLPDFPQVGVEEYKMLFDDGFSNVVESEFQTGEEWDIFVNQNYGNEITKKYIAGNDEEYTQMDVLQAEKKAVIDKSLVDKSNITTHRTRVMAYLTLDQMLFDDLLGSSPYGYYVNSSIKQS